MTVDVAQSRANAEAGDRSSKYSRVVPAYRRGVETRQKILDVASSLIATKGFRATTVNDIAEHSGVSGPSLFYYFRTKSDILAALLFQLSQDLAKAFDDALQHVDDNPDDRLTALIGVYVDQIARKRAAFRILFIEVRSLRERDIEEVRRNRMANRERFAQTVLGVRPDLNHDAALVLSSAAIWSMLSMAFTDDTEVRISEESLILLKTHVFNAIVSTPAPEQTPRRRRRS